jgi:hypothetical protein
MCEISSTSSGWVSGRRHLRDSDSDDFSKTLPHNSRRIVRFSRIIRIPRAVDCPHNSEHLITMARRSKKALDKISGKRGPKRRAYPSGEIFGRAENYRLIFQSPGVWEALYPLLSKAQNGPEVEVAFAQVRHAGIYVNDEHQFVPHLADLIVKVIHDPDFPKKRPDRQIAFFADSLAARGSVSPRRSRDICEKERGRRKKAHYIVRCEFYVECSCSYKGPSLNNACRKCGAPIVFDGFGHFIPNFKV